MLFWWTEHFPIQLCCLYKLIWKWQRKRWLLVTLNTSHMGLMRHAAQTNPSTLSHILYIMPETCCNKTSQYKKCWGTQRWDHGLCFVWTDSHGKVGTEGAQVQKWVFILLMMWIPARPLSAHTNCLWASSHSTRHFFCRDFRSSSIVMVLGRGKVNDWMMQNGSTLNKRTCTLDNWQKKVSQVYYHY